MPRLKHDKWSLDEVSASERTGVEEEEGMSLTRGALVTCESKRHVVIVTTRLDTHRQRHNLVAAQSMLKVLLLVQ